jgi:hypothetical protein
MNVLFDIFISLFTAVCNASVKLLQNESHYMIAMVILRNDYAGEMWCS